MALVNILCKPLEVVGYLMLYIIAILVAGLIGWATAHVAEKWILKKFLGARLKAYRDLVEGWRGLCVLTCGTGFLIVALGLLFMHLAGGLGDDYGEIVGMMGIAFFGLVVFVALCLGILSLALSVMWAFGRCRGKYGSAQDFDEERALLKRTYPKGDRLGEAFQDEDDGDKVDDDGGVAERVEDAAEEVPSANDAPPQMPGRTWIRMAVLSSVGELDIQGRNRGM